ncbi:hypothetical protein [Nocardioides alkalitolerans]|uniref:hypothetical protein n=1 Tax=Nocardioides alkalitolerans TaxID=281714 RepID=UPI0003FB6286|nr:hypothetical protein [Nocardioides alkalitolerans]
MARRHGHRAVAAVAVALLAAGTSACSPSAGVADGDTVAPAVTALVEGTTTRVMLPAGALDLTVGEPRDEVPAHQTATGETVAAPDGDVVLGVGWRLQPTFADNGANFGTPGTYYDDATARTAERLRVRLRVGDETREVPVVAGPDDGRELAVTGAAWLVVPAEGADAGTIEVEYDGLVQTLDLASGELDADVAAPLYAPYALPTRVACPTGELDPGLAGVLEVDAGCTAQLLPLPYVEGLGWAGAGRTWVVVDLVTYGDVTVVGRDFAGVDEVRQDGTLTADGDEAVVVPEAFVSADGPRWSGEVALQVPVGTSTTVEGRSTYALSATPAPPVAEVEIPYSFVVDATAVPTTLPTSGPGVLR